MEQSSQVKEAPKNKFLEARDKYKEAASELQKNVAEIQSAKYETALYQLMSRTEDNSDLTNAMNSFLDILQQKASFGDPSQQLSKERKEDLIKFFKEKSKDLEELTAHNK